MPQTLPSFSKEEINLFATQSYQDVCFAVVSKFTDGVLPQQELRAMIDRAYSSFTHKAVLPLKQVSHNHYMAEMFYGETFAFKDFALSLLGQMIEYFVKIKNKKAVIIGATSGDTGSAAIYGCKNLDAASVYILFPRGMVSQFQKMQMVSTGSPSVYPLEVDGTFDDCQNIVKDLFVDEDFLSKLGKDLVAVNSVNFMRILAQAVYYFYTCSRLNQGCKIAVSVPSGNFGNIYSAMLAKQMGLKIDKFIVATNKNDILYRFFNAGDYSVKQISPTISPSIDISIASNFERFLYSALNCNADLTAAKMQELKSFGKITFSAAELNALTQNFVAFKAQEDDMKQEIQNLYNLTCEVSEPHTAAGLYAANCFLKAQEAQGYLVITFATASGVKFSDAVLSAGVPAHALEATMPAIITAKKQSNQQQKCYNLPAKHDLIKDFILQSQC